MKVSFLSALAVLTIIILFGFPKAGLYVGDVPITFGYVLLAFFGAFQLVRLSLSGLRSIQADHACLGGLFIILAGIEAGSFAAYGYQSMGNVISIVASTIVIPILAMLSIHFFLDMLGMQKFLQALRISLAIVFTFGVLSFAVYNSTGTVIGIPFLTTTGGDISLVAERHNLRGSIIKMFSTYNNGNILGVNLLIWGPIAAFSSGFGRFQLRSICVLTLSRSVWIGLATLEIINSISQRSVGRTLKTCAFVSLLMAVFVGASLLMGRDPTAFLLDRNLGGRVASFEEGLHGIKTRNIGWSNESLYAAAFLAFGWAGSLLIVLIWAVPIFRGGRSPIEVQCRIVLAVYMFIAAAEAAFNLVPTQASYWMIAGIAMGAGRKSSRQAVEADSPIHQGVASVEFRAGIRERDSRAKRLRTA